MKPRITAKGARALLRYDPASGHLFWRVKRGRMAAGMRAGTIVHKNGKSYRQINIGGRFYTEHGVAWLIVKGRWPDPEIDHEDGDGTNNRWRNLREATSAQNKFNRAAKSNSKTGLKGVRVLASGRFQASISAVLGTYKTPMAAHLAYCRAAKFLHGNFANTKSHAAAQRGPSI